MNSRSKLAGFTLIEILIATALGVALIATVLRNYLTAKSVYRDHNEVIVAGENIRFTDFFLWQNIMQAGFLGCASIDELNFINHTTENFEARYGICGFDGDKPPLFLRHRNVVKATDVIVIAKVDTKLAKLTADVKPGSNVVHVDYNPATRASRYLLISDCKNAELVEAKNYLGKEVRLEQPLKYAYNSSVASIGLFEEMAFFISRPVRATKEDSSYGLYYSINHGVRHELAPGINSLKVLYGVGRDDGCVVEEYLDSKKITAANMWSRVLSLKIDFGMQIKGKQSVRTLYIKLRRRC